MTSPLDVPLSLEARERELTHQISVCSRNYYVYGGSDLTDAEFDALVAELRELERLLGRSLPGSPTQKVGSDLAGGFAKVEHARPMLSLDNVFSAEEVKKFFGDPTEDLVVEPKYDGVSLSLQYEQGRLARATTRGDGAVGEDVTANAKTIASIPLTFGTFTGEVRGEVVMRRTVLSAINQQREKSGEDPLANTRNAASGSLKLKDPREVAARQLSFFAYGVYGDGLPATHRERLKLAGERFATAASVPTLDGKQVHLLPDLTRPVAPALDQIEKLRPELDVDLDGCVVKVNSIMRQEELGLKTKAPRWACAYKFKPEQAVTILEDIQVTVGRTGQVTPVAVLRPVRLEGAMISSASLMNFNELERIGNPGIGDHVLVERSAGVIPRTVGVKARRAMRAWSFPKLCPHCQTELVRRGVHYYDPNPDCPEQVYARLRHATAKTALDWDGMGESQLRGLIERGCDRLSDLLSHDPAWMKPAAKKKFMAERERVKSATLWRKLAALGIEDVGQTTCKELAQRYRSLTAVVSASTDELLSLLGPVAFKSLIDYINVHAEEIERLTDLGMAFEEQGSSGPLSGKTVVITGTLMSGTRDAVSAKIEKAGGLVKGSVGKATSYLVVGELPGANKTAAAAKHGTKVISEEELYSLMGLPFELASPAGVDADEI